MSIWRSLLATAGLGWISAGPALAAPLAPCTEAAMADLPRPALWYAPGTPAAILSEKLRSVRGGSEPIKALFDVPVLTYPFGSLQRYGFEVTLVVGTDGAVACASAADIHEDRPLVMTPQRQAFMKTVAGWRFEPYSVDGKPSRAVETFQINEEERPREHVAPPAGDPALITITQDNRPMWASYSPYHVELHGDGTAIYTPYGDDDMLGPQTYHVNAAAVQALAKAAETADFWSLRDVYRLGPGNSEDGSYMRLNITLGGKTKSLENYDGGVAGMPAAADALQRAVMDVANVRFWQTPTLATLDQLKANGYDFQSDNAIRLLLSMIENDGVSDDAIMALMDLRGPLPATDDPFDESESDDGLWDSLEAALNGGRAAVAARTIAEGALLADGKRYSERVDAAFVAAVHSGKLAVVDLILPYKPALTYREGYGDQMVEVSVIRKLDNHRADVAGRIAVAERLLALGADINARAFDGTTLLHVSTFEPAFVVFLIDHGANVNATDNAGATPLSRTYYEETALLLLEHGADPRLGKSGKALRFNIVKNHWTRVKSWLTAHGFADVLIAKPGEDR